MNTTHSILAIIIAASVTLFTRALPFIIFGEDRQMSATVKFLGTTLPLTVVAVLVVYCLKDVNILTPPFGMAELLSVAAVALLHLWRRNNLLSIGVGTVLYMFFVQFIFI